MRFIIITICFCYLSCSGQSINNNLVDVKILNDSLQIMTSQTELVISIQCENHSDKNLLLYGFESNLIKPAKKLDEFCNLDNLGAGIALFVYDSENYNVFATFYIPDELKNKPMPKDTFENRMASLKEKYLAGTKVLKAFGSSYSDTRIDLKDFELPKGQYSLQVVYYSGKIVEKLAVGKERVEKDKKAHNAELYQGCVTSNRITFRVD